MTAAICSKAAALWFGILLLAVLNGALREDVLTLRLGLIAGTMFSGAILCCCIFAVAYAAYPWWGQVDAGIFWKIGGLWVALTVTFEVLFGIYVRGESWRTLLGAYTFKDGNLWSLVLVSTLTAPAITARMRRRT